MIYYSLATLAQCYDIEYKALKDSIKAGTLYAAKLFLPCDAHIMYKYIVPESELRKLEKFKISEPPVIPEDQPEHETKELSEKDIEKTWRLCFTSKDLPNNVNSLCTHYYRKRYDPNTYDEYQRSWQWAHLRRDVFKRDGFKCKICGSGINLVAHHVSYERLYCENEIDDIITLCRDCHSEIHKHDKIKKIEEENYAKFKKEIAEWESNAE